MPHIQLDTSDNLAENARVPVILARLVSKLCEFESVQPDAVKAYHALRHVWCMGEGAPHGFAHCTICLMTGRSIELRNKIADGIFALLKESFAASLESGEAGLTVEVREMERETYRTLRFPAEN